MNYDLHNYMYSWEWCVILPLHNVVGCNKIQFYKFKVEDIVVMLHIRLRLFDVMYFTWNVHTSYGVLCEQHLAKGKGWWD